MDKAILKKQIQELQYQGRLNKQSRVLKKWKQRWVVLTKHCLLTFKQQKHYKHPTEVIPLKTIISVKSCEQQLQIKHSFRIQTNEMTFYFYAENPGEKQCWINAIGKGLIKGFNKEE